ncbi:UPF0172-domain-containing protein [Coprinopsis marcescibilis]|uniref:UPF0172-domain-containing protein n=1 Tax=Coprinopsis marcescibilis TaxID=230819 RepID=A0A5C3KUT7_COPMA|nr:UPF0172-domain-containing protein [Coprinopsis marcescibilis]
MPPSVTLSSTAYYKVYFHAAKHPHQTINGVFLGKQAGNGAQIDVQDAIPLLHHWTSLSPMMEIGLDLADQYATEAGLKVVGYYQGRAALGDTSLGPVGEKIAQRLKEKFPDTFVLAIDGQEFGTEKAALKPWVSGPNDNNWKAISSPEAFTTKSSFQLSSPDLPTTALGFVREQSLHLNFGDFDDHLEDVTIDWIHNKACIPT